jgi:hypothetical protein
MKSPGAPGRPCATMRRPLLCGDEMVFPGGSIRAMAVQCGRSRGRQSDQIQRIFENAQLPGRVNPLITGDAEFIGDLRLTRDLIFELEDAPCWPRRFLVQNTPAPPTTSASAPLTVTAQMMVTNRQALCSWVRNMRAAWRGMVKKTETPAQKGGEGAASAVTTAGSRRCGRLRQGAPAGLLRMPTRRGPFQTSTAG